MPPFNAYHHPPYAHLPIFVLCLIPTCLRFHVCTHFQALILSSFMLMPTILHSSHAYPLHATTFSLSTPHTRFSLPTPLIHLSIPYVLHTHLSLQVYQTYSPHAHLLHTYIPMHVHSSPHLITFPPYPVSIPFMLTQNHSYPSHSISPRLYVLPNMYSHPSLTHFPLHHIFSLYTTYPSCTVFSLYTITMPPIPCIAITHSLVSLTTTILHCSSPPIATHTLSKSTIESSHLTTLYHPFHQQPPCKTQEEGLGLIHVHKAHGNKWAESTKL